MEVSEDGVCVVMKYCRDCALMLGRRGFGSFDCLFWCWAFMLPLYRVPWGFSWIPEFKVSVGKYVTFNSMLPAKILGGIGFGCSMFGLSGKWVWDLSWEWRWSCQGVRMRHVVDVAHYVNGFGFRLKLIDWCWRGGFPMMDNWCELWIITHASQHKFNGCAFRWAAWVLGIYHAGAE